jgi:hypothetical protein
MPVSYDRNNEYVGICALRLVWDVLLLLLLLFILNYFISPEQILNDFLQCDLKS